MGARKFGEIGVLSGGCGLDGGLCLSQRCGSCSSRQAGLGVCVSESSFVPRKASSSVANGIALPIAFCVRQPCFCKSCNRRLHFALRLREGGSPETEGYMCGINHYVQVWKHCCCDHKTNVDCTLFVSREVVVEMTESNS